MEVKGTLIFKGRTQGGKYHFIGRGVSGGIYLTAKELKKLGVEPENIDTAKLQLLVLPG